MVNATEHLALGFAGEEDAARYLAGEGWRILARNWRPGGAARGLELDIVALHGDCLVFVEVKTRRPHPGTGGLAGDGAAAEAFRPLSVPIYAALSAGKQRKLTRAAGRYLSAHDAWSRPCRFDLICIKRLPGGGTALEHYRDVIAFRPVVGGGDAAWQPW
jgi:putative endonuclease